jgi:hypothetical protein
MWAALALLLVLTSTPSGVHADAAVDWLVAVPETTSTVTTTPAGTLLLSNGLASREFALMPAFGTVDWALNATTARGGLQSMFRAVMPEGRLTRGTGLGTPAAGPWQLGGLQSATQLHQRPL